MGAKSKNRIILPFAAGRKIARVLNTTPGTVSQAINYTSNSDLAKKIRHIAIKEYGGCEVLIESANNQG